MGLVALWDMASSQTRDWTHVPCVGRQILIHWTSREVRNKLFDGHKIPRTFFPIPQCSISLLFPDLSWNTVFIFHRFYIYEVGSSPSLFVTLKTTLAALSDHWWTWAECQKNWLAPLCTFPAEVQPDNALPSCFMSHTKSMKRSVPFMGNWMACFLYFRAFCW